MNKYKVRAAPKLFFYIIKIIIGRYSKGTK